MDITIFESLIVEETHLPGEKCGSIEEFTIVWDKKAFIHIDSRIPKEIWVGQWFKELCKHAASDTFGNASAKLARDFLLYHEVGHARLGHLLQDVNTTNFPNNLQRGGSITNTVDPHEQLADNFAIDQLKLNQVEIGSVYGIITEYAKIIGDEKSCAELVIRRNNVLYPLADKDILVHVPGGISVADPSINTGSSLYDPRY